MEPQNHQGKFGGWTTKTSKEKAERAQEAKWAEKSGPVESRQQTLEEYMDWLAGQLKKAAHE
jgi:hypothetical protein